MNQIVEKATHIVNKKNIYVVLSLISIVVFAFGIYYLYKDYLTRTVATKFFDAYKELKPEILQATPFEILTLKRELSDKYKEYSIKQLKMITSLSNEEIKKIISGLIKK